MSNKVTYRQQFTRCGKQRCRKCKEGMGHGPYWYAYWSENGRTISKYIGIHAPAGSEAPANETTVNKATANKIEMSPHSVGESQHDPLLRVYLLGQLRIERREGSEWQMITNRTWHRRRVRALLGCLLSNSGRRIGREQAMEALWPDLDIEIAANRLNGAVHEVRQLLEPEITRPAASRMLRLERDILFLADARQVWVDADEFESLLNTANASGDPKEAEQLLEEAARLYSGDYLLEELYSEWAAPRRESLRRGWMGLLLKLAELRVARGALTSAIEPLDRLLSADPTHETAVRRLMVILTQLDRRGEALRTYRRLEETLTREYESEPLPETAELYNALRSGTFQVPRLTETHVSSEETVSTVSTASAVSTPGHPVRATPLTEKKPAGPARAGFQRPALQLGRHNQSRLIGRERELAAMQQFLLGLENAPSEETNAGQASQTSNRPKINATSATNGRARTFASASQRKPTHFLLLVGEAGLGKTRLAEEISNQAYSRNWSVLWAHTYEQERTISYRPWTEILRTLLKDMTPEFLLESLGTEEGTEARESSPGSLTASTLANIKLARLATLVPELTAHQPLDAAPSRPTATLTPEQERLHLWEATSALLRVISSASPLLIVLDDLHWTDDSSLELLAYVVRHLRNEPIAFVATCRDIELAPTSNLRPLINDLRREQSLLTLPIQPLDEGQIGSLVAHLPLVIIKSIQSQAGGNPFFAEELAALANTIQTSENDRDMASVTLPSSAMPETITAVLERRLGRLSQDCQTLLGRVAVLGGSFEFSQLASMVGDQNSNEDGILDLVEEALRAGLLTEEGTGTHITYQFWHPLIVSHLYERLSAARRAQLHRRAANTLVQAHPGSEGEVAAAITHHLIRGGSDPTLIARYAELAANRAFSLSAYSEAEHFYREAIEAISHSINTRTRENEDPLHLASLLERVAECNMIHGNFEENHRLYEQVLALRAQHHAAEAKLHPETDYQKRQLEAQRQALIWREIGRAWAETGDFDQAWLCFQHGKQVMQDAGVTSGAAWACLHLQQGNINWRRGNFDEARRYGQQALEMLELVMHNQQTGKSSLPITSSELPTRTALSMIGDPIELGRCHETLGIIAAALGQTGEALEHLKRTLAIFEQHGEGSALTLVYGNLGAVHSMRGENKIARVYFQRSLSMAERYNDQPNVAFVAGNLGDVAARSGDLIEAEEWFRRSITVAERINDKEQAYWSNVVLASVLQDQGQMQSALRHIRRGLALGRAVKSARFAGFALVALGGWRITRACELSNAADLIDTHPGAISHTGGFLEILARARRALERALDLEKLDAEVAIQGRLNLASVYYLSGEFSQARQTTMQSLQDAQEHELTQLIARSKRLLGRILAAQQCPTEADTFFEQALDMYSTHEMRLDYARTLHGYGVTLLQRSSAVEPLFQRGLGYLREAREIFERCGATIDIKLINRTLSNPDFEKAGV